MSERSKLFIELTALVVGIFACIAGYWALIPEDRRWPFSPDDSGEDVTETPETVDATPNPWAGIIDLDPAGLEAIRGYELWFSSLAGNRWQIWHLHSRTQDVNRIAFDLPSEKALLDQFVPAISPDGSRVAVSIGSCAENEQCNRDLYIADIGGDDVVQVTNNVCLDEFHPSWSPDGKALAYFSGSWNNPGCPDVAHGIWIVDVETRTTTQLTNRGDFDPVWSPNGEYIAYHSAEPSWDLKVLDLNTCGSEVNSCTMWIASDIGTISASAAWVNNSTLAFSSDESGDFELYTVPVIPQQTLKPTQITNNDWDDQYPATSTDGRFIIWQAFPYYETGDVGAATGKVAVIYVMDVSDLDPYPLITGIGNARDGFLRPISQN